MLLLLRSFTKLLPNISAHAITLLFLVLYFPYWVKNEELNPNTTHPESPFHPVVSKLLSGQFFNHFPLHLLHEGGEGKGVGMVWPPRSGADGCAG